MSMPTRWTVFDQMVRELGSLRVAATRMEDARDTAEGFEVARALADAATAVCRFVVDDDQQVLLDTWAAIARAQDVVRRASDVVTHTRQMRETVPPPKAPRLVKSELPGDQPGPRPRSDGGIALASAADSCASPSSSFGSSSSSDSSSDS